MTVMLLLQPRALLYRFGRRGCVIQYWYIHAQPHYMPRCVWNCLHFAENILTLFFFFLQEWIIKFFITSEKLYARYEQSISQAERAYITFIIRCMRRGRGGWYKIIISLIPEICNGPLNICPGIIYTAARHIVCKRRNAFPRAKSTKDS